MKAKERDLKSVLNKVTKSIAYHLGEEWSTHLHIREIGENSFEAEITIDNGVEIHRVFGSARTPAFAVKECEMKLYKLNLSPVLPPPRFDDRVA